MSDTHKLDPILLPIIRKVVPAQLVQDILSVQPMSSPFSLKEWPYQIDILSLVNFQHIWQVREWCTKNLPKDDWVSHTQFYAFKTEMSFVAFKLVWE